MKRSTANITPEDKDAFEALTSGEYSNFALFSCFVDGAPSAAICAITQEEENGEVLITPLFVRITPQMKVTDHDGVEAAA